MLKEGEGEGGGHPFNEIVDSAASPEVRGIRGGREGAGYRDRRRTTDLWLRAAAVTCGIRLAIVAIRHSTFYIRKQAQVSMTRPIKEEFKKYTDCGNKFKTVHGVFI